MIKWTEEKGVTVIAILFIIIAILGIIMAVKVLVPKQEQETYDNNIMSYNELILEQQKEEKEERKKDFESYQNKAKVLNSITNFTNSFLGQIIILLISCIISFGVGKLYTKLEMPNSVVIYTWAYPLINLVLSYIPFTMGMLTMIANIIILVMSFAVLYYYFKALNISPAWIIVPFASIFLIAIGITTGNTALMVLLGIIAAIGAIVFIGIWILTSIRLAERFEKGKGFIVGLVLLPFIFQPILGYQKEN